MADRSRTPYTILGCLTVEPMSGYDVQRFLEQSVVHFWSESPGQIYPALKRLEEEGLVEGRDEPGQRGQEKRVYRITEEGRRELRGWLEEPAEPVRPRYEHSLKLFFGYEVGTEASLEHVDQLRRRTLESLAEYREWEERLAERAQRDPGSPAPYWLVVLRGGIRYSEMVLRWCDETEATLRDLGDSGRASDARAGDGKAGDGKAGDGRAEAADIPGREDAP